MCTVTHWRDSGRLLVTMNRDELSERAPEVPPAIYRSLDGGSWLAPGDGNRFGAWIGAGDRGLAACILNRYPSQSPITGPASRGDIIPKVFEFGDFHGAAAWLTGEFDPRPYPPFMVILTSLCGASALFAWEGKDNLRRWRGFKSGWQVETSSSWREPEVIPFRLRAFGDWLRAGTPFRQLVPEFHVLCVPGKEAWSPLMRRPASQTRSITQIEFDAASARLTMRYWPEPFSSLAKPCNLTIPLRLEAASASPDPRLPTALSQ